ncbi:helix-turn-helix domain-containing protein [Chryseobacterium taichungense]|uniref:helix-turn-helix domain-containing protein n=1 Tax=Chryseobacterium taichungense TaxID=295069 RepID=UPI0028AB2D6E|nr:helix-turn-helix domain-containing protein [Chryseobacterium taichungense]
MKKNLNAPMNEEQLLTAILDIFSEILVHLQKPATHESPYYDNADLKRMLNISDSTLLRIRRSKDIPYVRIGRKIFYPKWVFNDYFKSLSKLTK